MARRFETDDGGAGEQSEPCPTTYTRLKQNSRNKTSPTNDAFEDEIACSIDALDNIPESRYNSPKTSLEHPVGGEGGGGLESDEVRIMSKVLGGGGADRAGCLQALDLTDWNVHRAIKLVKLKTLVNKAGVKDNEMKVNTSLLFYLQNYQLCMFQLALINQEWDVSRAAGEIMNR